MRRLLFALTSIAAVAMCVIVSAQVAQVSGLITYRERIALPPTAVVEVTLEDVTRVDLAPIVIARAEITFAGEVPIPYAMAYDPAAIDRSRRYGVRVRVVDRGQVIFATAQPGLVLTQGRGTEADLVLTMVSTPAAAPAAARMAEEARTTSAVRLPPPVELRNLPASFTGTIEAPGAAPVRYQLDLFPDDSYFLRSTPAGGTTAGATDSVGSWVLSSDRRAIILEGAGDEHETYAIRDSNTLRRIALGDRAVASGARDLRRAARFAPVDVRATLRGVYRSTDNGGTFTECRTGQRWAVAPSAAADALAAAAGTSRAAVDPAVLVSVDGHLRPSRTAGAALTLEVGRLVATAPAGGCEPRFAAAPLENTFWRLTRLGGQAVAPAADKTPEPGLTFRDTPRAFGGSGGCNHLAGGYQVGTEMLLLQPVGTLRACPDGPGADVETQFRTALTDTRGYRILGRTLELLNAERQTLARFEAQ